MHMPSFVCAISALIVLILAFIFLSFVEFIDLHSTPNEQIEQELEENYFDTSISTI